MENKTIYNFYEDGLKVLTKTMDFKPENFKDVVSQVYCVGRDYLNSIKPNLYNMTISQVYAHNIINIHILTRSKFYG